MNSVMEKISQICREERLRGSPLYPLEAKIIAFSHRTVSSLYYYFLRSRARVQNASLIYVIGDSHTESFIYKSPFIVRHMGPVTAYNVGRGGSERSEQLNKEILKMDINRDIVLLVYGEIDARVHVCDQYERNEGRISVESIIDKIVNSYGLKIIYLKAIGCSVCVYGIPPASRLETSTKDIKVCGTSKQRSDISRIFNKKLKEFCYQHNVLYIDIQSMSATEDGFIRDEYVKDEIHLNNLIEPFVFRTIANQYRNRLFKE